MKPAKKLPLTKECHHWRRLGEVPWDLQKYWQQRHTIFSNYNEGVYMTHDAWYGVTPEPVAIQIANDVDGVFPDPHKSTIVDLFAGVGNNAISFALQPHPEADGADGGQRRRWDRVVAVERDPATLACAQHNAALHGLGPESIVWVLGDSFAFLERAVAPAHRRNGDGKTTTTEGKNKRKKRQKKTSSSSRRGKRRPDASSDDSDASEDNDEDDDDDDITLDPTTTVLFASPPWGGPGYSTDAVFDLSTMEPYNLARLHAAYRAVDHALYLPRTSDLRQIARLAPSAQPAQKEKENGDARSSSSSSKEEEGKKKMMKIEVVQYCVEGASKALVAYIPAATATTTTEEMADSAGEEDRRGQRDGDSGLERAMELD